MSGNRLFWVERVDDLAKRSFTFPILNLIVQLECPFFVVEHWISLSHVRHAPMAPCKHTQGSYATSVPH